MAHSLRDGTLREPDLHDGRLIGIRAGTDHVLELECLSSTGETCVLRLGRLVRLRAEGFLEGNIIFEFRVYTGVEIPDDLLTRAFRYSEEDAERWLSRDREQAVSDQWILVELVATYGCELLAVGPGPLSVDMIRPDTP